MNILVFDIETVPDIATGRLLYPLEAKNSDDKEVAKLMYQKRQEKMGVTGFLPHHLQRIVAISTILCSKERFDIRSLGNIDSPELTLIKVFFQLIEKYVPLLISWNGSGFDLPVLHYRALLYGISSPSYWDIGDKGNVNFRWNNYLNRYHHRHTDLMDVLAGYQGRANAPLHEIALMLGLPGKLGIEGSQVWDLFQEGQLETIRNYCETDVLNTYLIYLRFEVIRGRLTPEAYQQKCNGIRETLNQKEKPHLKQFTQSWKN